MPPQAVSNGFFRTLFDAIPSPILLVDDDGRIEDVNAAGARVLGGEESFFRKKGGDALRCIQSFRSPEGCGHGPGCADCVVRNSLGEAFAGGKVTRRRARLELRDGKGGTAELYLLVTASPFEHEGRRLVLLPLEDINELVALKALLPVCSWCRKVRGGDDYWQSVEEYLKTHADVDVSHSICDECLERQLREVDTRIPPLAPPSVRK